jgi:RES domain-containing protein
VIADGPPLPGEPILWRLDRDRHAAQWDSGEGAYLLGGRWNNPGTRVVYCALDAATAVLEVAVHVGFRQLAAVPHVLTSARLDDLGAVHFVRPADVPDADWLRPGEADPAQRAFGDRLIRDHPLVAIPSVASRNSWNLLIAAPAADDVYALRDQEPFVLDPRLSRSQ